MPSANATTGYVVVFINEWWYTQYLVKVPSTWKTLHWVKVLGSLLTKTPVSEDCFYLLHTCLWYCLKCVSDSACRHYQQGEGGSRHLLSKYCKYPCTMMSKLENTKYLWSNKQNHYISSTLRINSCNYGNNRKQCSVFWRDAGNSGSGSIWRPRMFTLTMTNAGTCALALKNLKDRNNDQLSHYDHDNIFYCNGKIFNPT